MKLRFLIPILTASIAMDTHADTPNQASIVLGGGCFWCLEAVYEEVRGVSAAVSGYAGGHVPSPSYKQVTGGRTGHAEVVEIQYDPQQVSLDTLLDVYFTIHDPTTRDRQGNDVGPQYRSIAFYRNDAEKAAIEAAIARTAQSGEWRGSIVTQVEPLETFWPAEDYHQEYFELNGEQPYCSLVIAPKVAKFRKRFVDLLK
ncbi:MAG: peptide-methionine (S)-S-oxide reductase MsrA [Xanthomonadales bacterium]|nr:Peptide methionine sulfoxide reductase MsrA/MsrB [Xanthomonadales bacterium]MCC6592395.1 peptide-methionine (S)-S-oxide reductase MsrA [Xanthomonadales bacterium]MCE7930401.1 peptide-methionine (S)-S-oxide reductase [Xanthomonadales bacterium PRO6]